MASWQGCDETAEERARRLAEELRQCQADKDFVWSLWKRLQEDKPDVSQVVRMVIQRENQRAEEKASKVLEILQVKDHKIRELEQQSNAQQRELDDLERRRAAVEESISLREQLSALSTHWEESTRKTQALRHGDVETESVLVQELRKRCADLQTLLDNAQDAAKAGIEKQQQADRLQNRVDELSSQLSVQERELAQARKDLEEVQALCRESVRHTCKQTHLLKEMQSLHLKNQHTLQQQEELHKASIGQQEESTTGELSRQLNIIQEQRRTLEAKDKQLAELQSRVACWEDDAETERRLSQEKRDRRMDAQQQEGAHQSATSKLEQRVKELVEERAHQKTKLENIQRRLAVTSRENVLLENGSRELRVQLQTKEQQVHALEKGMQQAERTAGELHAAARSEMHALAGKSEHAQACVAEFKSIVRVLASELQQQVNEVRAALLHREQRDANVSVAVSQAKILAASILNLSESELSEIMDANQMAETCEDEMWMQQLDIILDSQPPFSVALQQHLREKRQERARLASQLQQQDATPQHKQQPPKSGAKSSPFFLDSSGQRSHGQSADRSPWTGPFPIVSLTLSWP